VKKVLLKPGMAVHVYCLYEGNRSDLIEFIESLDDSSRAKIYGLIERTADYGPHPSREKYRKLHGGIELWELKAGQVRIMLFYDETGNMVLTHGFLKKGDKTPKNQIDRGLRMKQEYFVQLGELP